jgi:hypothetical protein
MGIKCEITPNIKIKVSNRKELRSLLKKLEERTLKLVPSGFSKLTAFEALRYVIVKEDNYWLCEEFFGKNIGDDETIWKVLAPVVEDGSTLEIRQDDVCSEEDDETIDITYVFKNKKLEIT